MSGRSRTLAVYLIAALVAALVLPATAAAARSPRAEEEREQRNSIFISKNDHFDPAHGVRSGTGTADDPFIFSGWDVGHLEIRDTSKYVRIVDNNIGTLVLDWIGGGIDVQRNTIDDLRVNQNRKRTGEATSGLIANNKFGFVGQLRHFDGVFENNQVGTKDAMLEWPGQRTVNFDGFNGAIFRNNVIYGWMEARLHGHHHSSSFAGSDTSHYHGAAEDHAGHEMMDHSQRYHRVYISGNTIYSNNDYALMYTDTAHAANDRTAASETDKALNDPHVHYTKVFLHDNKLLGGSLWVNVFNAQDKEKHLETATGLVDIRNNEIALAFDHGWWPAFKTIDGISIERAQDVRVNIVGNKVVGPQRDETQASIDEMVYNQTNGIALWEIDKATIMVADNTVVRHVYGVTAAHMSNTVNWTITGLRAEDVEYDVYYDGDNVKNPPTREQQ